MNRSLRAPASTGPAMPEPFRQLTVLEPKLVRVWDDAAYCGQFWERHPARRHHGRWADWTAIRIKLHPLIGPGRPGNDDILGSIPAYECAVRALRAAMGMEG